MLAPYAARLSGLSGLSCLPAHGHGGRDQGPGPGGRDGAAREAGRRPISSGSRRPRRALPLGEKLRRRVSQLYRSKGERRQIAGYYAAEFRDRRRRGGSRRPGSRDPPIARDGGLLSSIEGVARASVGAVEERFHAEDRRSTGCPGPGWRDLERAGPDAAAGVDAQPRRVSRPAPPPGRCARSIPPVTTAAWTTMMTGCGPARHGVFDHRYYDAAEGRMKVNHSGRIRVPTVWHLLSGTGRSIVSLNLPGLVSPAQGAGNRRLGNGRAPPRGRPLGRPRVRRPAARPRRPATAWATSGSGRPNRSTS